MMSWAGAVLGPVLGAASACVLGGCLISSDNTTAFSGNYVDNASLSQVELRRTTAAEAEAILGPPSEKNTLEDGGEHWTWHYTKTKHGSGTLLFVLDANDTYQVQQTVNVLFRDGVAVKKWRD